MSNSRQQHGPSKTEADEQAEKVSPQIIRAVVEKEDDFGFELRVGNVIESIRAFQMEHGGTYTDSVTDKPRQFDYRCVLEKEEGRQRLCLAVECKNLCVQNPLVVSGIGRREDDAFHDFIQTIYGMVSI